MEAIDHSGMPLDRFALGKKARVLSLAAGGRDRRRMLDLGIIDGTCIEPLYASPSGNPVAYRVRGAVIALRTDVAEKIRVVDAQHQDFFENITGTERRQIALAGNPNVGKSTVFNALTGLRQHTGNWPGKTVENARGSYRYKEQDYELVDVPGTYSLLSVSTEEEIARDFICFGQPDVTLIVADATCLERNLNLVLQILEITEKAVLCVNLLDEARKKKITVDIPLLSCRLGIPVVGTSARTGKGLEELMEAVAAASDSSEEVRPFRVTYSQEIEEAVSMVVPAVEDALGKRLNSRWLALKLLDRDEGFLSSLAAYLGFDLSEEACVKQALEAALCRLREQGFGPNEFRDEVVSQILAACEEVAASTVQIRNPGYNMRDQRIDRILTSKFTGIPIMLFMLFAVFWITIEGANVPSGLLADGLFSLIQPLKSFLSSLSAPVWLTGLLVDGVYKTLAWVVSVMLPPMAIFFPLFTLLEDLGYLPRVAFNLDNSFRRCCAHGKQSLTMCMGFGCNACGVIGCRIIDSPRERLIAILTNNFVPCNGRFPTLIAIITMFFAGVAGGLFQSFTSAALLLSVIVLGVVMTLLVSKFLSRTFLKGMPSSFQLELPPYRRPQIGKVVVRSILDRTLFVLARAVCVAAPAGLILWFLANIQIGDASLLAHCAEFLDPLARLMGMDGYILLAFILGFPANEIVIPILIMGYTATGSLTDFSSLEELRALFAAQGWTGVTALCVMLFSLMHWPCATTCLTIRKETRSLKWTLLSMALPTVCGIILCMLVANTARLAGLA